ncbi:hypothetical protein ACPCSQ_15775 [Streptomyces griseoincarnatus]
MKGPAFKGPAFDHGLRRTEYTLFLAATLLGAAGAFSDTLWLLGIGAWALIAADLIDMIHQPLKARAARVRRGRCGGRLCVRQGRSR